MKKLIKIMLLIIGLTVANKSFASTERNGPKLISNKGKKDTLMKEGSAPREWKEHWFEHNQLLTNLCYNDDVAIYYDREMDRDIIWPAIAFTKIWAYVKKTYGSFGESGRLYVILHANKYGGGHPAPYYDSSHDYRNVLDVGLGLSDWYTEDGDKLKLPIHEIGHIVASSSHGRTHDLQDDNIWGDSKFAEIFIYDVLMNTGYKNEAEKVRQQMLSLNYRNNSSYPGCRFPGVNFFVDWFYPIYTRYGQGAVLSRYFEEISRNVPMDRTEDLNLGEFVHFFSGASGVNLRPLAKKAFGVYWNKEVEQQFKIAQKRFPGVKYSY